MKLVVLDFETYWSDTYTLSKMTTEAYVRDPRFYAHGVGLLWSDGRSEYLQHDQIAHRFSQLDWTNIGVVAHHAHFDGLILNHVYGITPAFWICTLSMARAMFPGSSVSLANICKKLGIEHEGSGKGQLNTKNVKVLTPVDAKALGEYCIQDCQLTQRLWEAMKRHMPVSELQLIDMNIRMFTEPVLCLNGQMLTDALEDEVDRKQAMLDRVGATKEMLGSNEVLAKTLEDLGVEPPLKLSPAAAKRGEDKWVYAFAKGDEEFAALLEHPNPEVVALVEARLGVKSSIKETRTQRLIGIGQRGPMPVYYNYYGAHTGRFSGGDKINLQNLNRGSALREAIEAPPGHVLVVRDLSQIEARVLACTAGQWDIVEAFAQNRDVYSEMASTIYGRKVDRKKNQDDFIPGFIGKAVVLGCLGPDTQVLTDSGWKSIVCVKATDKLWDGVEWVSHSGLVTKGEKECLLRNGLLATPDHEILTGRGWEEWGSVLTDHSLFQSATSLVRLPSPDGSNTALKGVNPRDGNHMYVASVDGRGVLTGITCSPVEQLGATPALKSAAMQLGKSIGGTLPLFPMIVIGNGSSIEFLRASHDATLRTLSNLNIMEEGVSTSTKSGEQEWKGVERSLHISLASPGGTDLSWRSTGSTLIKGMSPGTSVLLQGPRIATTDEQFAGSKSRSMTYDIAYAGPRNRFTVATTAGAVIVHNCGYGLGWRKFQQMIRIGMLGMKGITFDQTMADELGVNTQAFQARFGKQVEETLPAGKAYEEHLVHCAVAKHIIDTFRNNNPKIVALWGECQRALPKMLEGADSTGYLIGVEPQLTLNTECIMLPNGMRVAYPNLRSDKRGEFTVTKKKGNKIETNKVYGGLCTENIVQALARIVITDSMLKMKTEGMRVVLMTHDEIVVCCPEADGERVYQRMGEIMGERPSWSPSLPLASEGGYAYNYSK